MTADPTQSLPADFVATSDPAPARAPGTWRRCRVPGSTLPGSLLWFARHEIRLALRDWIRPGKAWRAILSALAFAIVLHIAGLALAHVVPPAAEMARPGPAAALRLIESFAMLSILAMMIAQAMDAVTRAFYVRGDLDLILSSPASAPRLFTIRMLAVTLTTLSLVGFLLLPFVNMLALVNDWHWLAIYGVLIALAALAQSIALGITIGLFRLIGPKRTRLTAQVVGAVIGAVTVIGTQVPVILRSGTFSRFGFLHDQAFLAALPGPSSLVWLPARAASGNLAALVVLLALSGAAFALTVAIASRHFATWVAAAAGVASTIAPARRSFRFARRNSAAVVLRAKELRLILRDPWLISQSLMQILYLIPPALMLWRNFGDAAGHLTMLVPVIVMAAGQLAGGLAWLAISAEDAPDLIAAAPIAAGRALRSKVEAVLIAVGAVISPFLLGIAWGDPVLALLGAGFAIAAAASNTYVQYAFRSVARRSQFRLRQRSSRMATLTETFVSIGWASASGLAGAGSGFVAVPVVMVAVLLLLCRWRDAARG
ncbi:MAG: permease [Ancalomicrobiaceae bacterium]|nr:permease [Ancalomicrobiaceae bacterium]